MFAYEQYGAVMENRDEQTLGMEIRKTSNKMKCFIDRTLDTKMDIKLTGIEGMTIGYIGRNQDKHLTSSDLMNRFKISKATISQILSGLEKKNLITMKSPEEDKRKKMIVLTSKGQGVVEKFYYVFKETINPELEKGLTKEEIEITKRVLNKIISNLDEEGNK